MNADPKFRPVPLSHDGGVFKLSNCQTCASCDATGLIFGSFSESQCPPPPPSFPSPVSPTPTGYDSAGSVLLSPVPHQMMSYMNMGSLTRTELQLLNQLHCRRKRRHRTIFTDEQLEALEGLFQETKYPDVGTREQLARKVHLREEKVEVSFSFLFTAQILLEDECKRVPKTLTNNNNSKPVHV